MCQRHRLPRKARRHKWAGVIGAVAFHPACHEDSRKPLVRRQLEIRVVLVVAKQDVVLGASLLDQVVFEGQRLDHRVGHDEFELGNLVEEGVCLGI